MKLILLFVIAHISLFSTAQRVGIGTTSPNARLEIVGEGSNSSTNALLLKNSVNDTLFRIRNDGRISMSFNGTTFGRTFNVGGNGLNIYRTDEIFSGCYFSYGYFPYNVVGSWRLQIHYSSTRLGKSGYWHV